MKKLNRLFLIVIFSLSFLTLHAQTETDTSFRSTINNIFLNLDKTKIPYEILRDYGMELANLDNFNGTVTLADSNYVDAQVFWEVYNSLLTSRIHRSATGFLRQDTVGNRWYRNRQAGQITLSGLYFLYSQFRSDAPGNTLTVSGNQLFDKYISGVWQDPYLPNTSFVIAPSVTNFKETSFNILLPSGLWITNNGSAISSISIDVGNGAGYQTLTVDVLFPVTYSTVGDYEWKYRIALTGGGYLYAHSFMTISNN